MANNVPKGWIYFLVLLVLVIIIVVLVGKSLRKSKSESNAVTLLLEEKTDQLKEMERQIQEKDGQIDRLEEKLKENSSKVVELETRLEETAKALSSAEQKLKKSEQKVKRLASARERRVEPTVPRPREPVSSRARSRPAEPGIYETIRTTSVFERPSGTSKKIATIEKETRVTVVGSVGEWLEVRSKHGNPPGFISREDAMFIERKR